jgi:hypothetical protein
MVGGANAGGDSELRRDGYRLRDAGEQKLWHHGVKGFGSFRASLRIGIPSGAKAPVHLADLCTG